LIIARCGGKCNCGSDGADRNEAGGQGDPDRACEKGRDGQRQSGGTGIEGSGGTDSGE